MVTAPGAPWRRPPPSAAEALPLTVTLVSVSAPAPAWRIPPPSPWALFPLTVTFVMVRVPVWLL